MNPKTFGLFAFGILALVLVMGLGSAVIVLNPATHSESIVQGSSDSFTFTIENTDSTSTYSNFSAIASSFVSGSNTLASSNIVVGTLPSSLTPGNTSSNITVTINVPSNQVNGTYTGTITIDADGSTTNPNSQTLTLSITVTPSATLTETAICSYSGGVSTNNGDLKVDIRDITVLDGFGKDDEWLLFDEVEVEIRVENNGNLDVDDISLEWAIANDDLTDFAVDFDEIDEFNLKDGDEDTFTVTFRVDDDDLDFDLDELSGIDYNLVVRATGVIDDNDNLFTVDDTCGADFSAVSVQEESNFVVLRNIELPETLQCGQTVDLRADVWNIGDSAQDEVKVDVYDKERLFIDKIFEVGDLDEFENTDLSLSFDIPENAEEKTHTLILRVLDEDSDLYENDYDDDPAEFFVSLVVSGGCSSASEVTVSASTVSGGTADSNLVVKATVTNTGDSQKVYSLNVAGSESWASSFSLDKSSLALGAGQSGDVTVTLSVNKGVSGSQTFFLEMVSDGELVSQPVSVVIEESSGFLGITGNVFSGGNSLIWGIGLLNLILVIVIIVIAVRIARRK